MNLKTRGAPWQIWFKQINYSQNDLPTLQLCALVRLALCDTRGFLDDLNGRADTAYLLMTRGQVSGRLGDNEQAVKDLVAADQKQPGIAAVVCEELEDDLNAGVAPQLSMASLTALRHSIQARLEGDALISQLPNWQPDRSSLAEKNRRAFRPQDTETAVEANELIIQAVARLQTKDYPGALADLNHADNIRPGDYATVQFRGMLKMDTGDAEGALADLVWNADTPDSLLRRGAAHLMCGHMEDAFTDIVDADKLVPGSASELCQAITTSIQKGSLQYVGVNGRLMDTARLVSAVTATTFEQAKVSKKTRDSNRFPGGATVQDYMGFAFKHEMRSQMATVVSNLKGSQDFSAARYGLKRVLALQDITSYLHERTTRASADMHADVRIYFSELLEECEARLNLQSNGN